MLKRTDRPRWMPESRLVLFVFLCPSGGKEGDVSAALSPTDVQLAYPEVKRAAHRVAATRVGEVGLPFPWACCCSLWWTGDHPPARDRNLCTLSTHIRDGQEALPELPALEPQLCQPRGREACPRGPSPGAAGPAPTLPSLHLGLGPPAFRGIRGQCGAGGRVRETLWDQYVQGWGSGGRAGVEKSSWGGGRRQDHK